MISPRRLSARCWRIVRRNCKARSRAGSGARLNHHEDTRRAPKTSHTVPCSKTPSSISSPSPKSISASTRARHLTISSRICSKRARLAPYHAPHRHQPFTSAGSQQTANAKPRTPDILTASLRCPSVSASTRSRRPSTCVKSSLPPSNARRVNSPGSAGRHGGRGARAARTAAMVARPEWMCSSRTSSVVNDLGPGAWADVSVAVRGLGGREELGERACL